MKTRARLEGEEWVLNGTKQFITNGDRAKTFVVMAVTAPDKGKEGVSAFVIERGLRVLRPGSRSGNWGCVPPTRCRFIWITCGFRRINCWEKSTGLSTT